ncbi:MAG: hypothetical protein RLZZ618_4274 [Pseudomonadota bacterium]|jgi:hypothetical protein
MSAPFVPTTLHQRRLREVWRSAGWPCQDLIEIDLLAAGLLERVRQPSGPDCLRVTDAGVRVLADTLQRNRAKRDAHEALVECVAREMTRNGRLAWQGLSLLAPLARDDTSVALPLTVKDAADDALRRDDWLGEPPPRPPALPPARWVSAMPDVYSVRHTTVEAYLEPIVHEVKVRRSDLLADLNRPAKRAAYLALSSQCWYVLKAGIAEPHEVPPECGVIFATGTTLDVARPAPRRPFQMPFGLWMALARSTPMPGWRAEEAQACLGETQQLDDLDRPAD